MSLEQTPHRQLLQHAVADRPFKNVACCCYSLVKFSDVLGKKPVQATTTTFRYENSFQEIIFWWSSQKVQFLSKKILRLKNRFSGWTKWSQFSRHTEFIFSLAKSVLNIQLSFSPIHSQVDEWDTYEFKRIFFALFEEQFVILPISSIWFSSTSASHLQIPCK